LYEYKAKNRKCRFSPVFKFYTYTILPLDSSNVHVITVMKLTNSE